MLMGTAAKALFQHNQAVPRAVLARLNRLDARIGHFRSAIKYGDADIEQLHYHWGLAAGEQGALWFAYAVADTPRAALEAEYDARVARADALALIRASGGMDVKRAAYDHGVNEASAFALKIILDKASAA